jgi:hypothetical protein
LTATRVMAVYARRWSRCTPSSLCVSLSLRLSRSLLSHTCCVAGWVPSCPAASLLKPACSQKTSLTLRFSELDVLPVASYRGGGGAAELLHASCRHTVAASEVEGGGRIRRWADIQRRRAAARPNGRQGDVEAQGPNELPNGWTCSLLDGNLPVGSRCASRFS